jgi:hypothetical protein
MKRVISIALVMMITSGHIVAAEHVPNWARCGGDHRGMYFSKKKYTKKALPLYEESKALLPQPILEDNPEWIKMYWKCWELAFSHLRTPDPTSPYVSNYVDEAFNNNIFQWDTIFMVMFWRYGHNVFPAVQSFDNFYCRQHEDGFICREIWETGGNAGVDHHKKTNPQAINPPLFSWAEVESYRLTGDKERLRSVMTVLEKYVTWLETGRSREGEELYWSNSLGSGMDNTPQGGSMWIGMSAQMVRQYGDLAFIAGELGEKTKAAAFTARANVIAEKINRLMWDKDTGFYWNLNKEHKWKPCKAISFSWTLMAGVPSKEQAELVAKNLMDETTFNRLFPFATLAATHPRYDPGGGYWNGSTWAPTTYQAIKGLERYGYDEYAAEASKKYITGMAAVFKETGTVWENYSPDAYTPGNDRGKRHSKPDFVGWSGCGPIALLFENIMGLRPDAAGRVLTWKLRRTDRHGVEQYHIADANITLICEKRKSANAPASITLKSDKAFSIKIVHPNKTVTISLKPGKKKTIVVGK